MKWQFILIIVLSIILFILIIFYAFCFSVFKKTFGRNKPTKKEIDKRNKYLEQNPEIEESINKLKSKESVRYEIMSDDNLKLVGYYYKASKENKRILFSVHGWHSSGINNSIHSLPFLFDEYDVFQPDLRSHGESEGKYIGFSVLDYKDILKWLNFITVKYPDKEILLVGCSMGGATVMRCADKVPNNVKLIIEDCGFTDAYEEIKYVVYNNAKIFKRLIFNGASLLVKKKAKYSLKNQTVYSALKNAKVPMMFIHGMQDTLVDPKCLDKAYNACKSKKEIIRYKDSTHARNYIMHKQDYEAKVRQFITRYF